MSLPFTKFERSFAARYLEGSAIKAVFCFFFFCALVPLYSCVRDTVPEKLFQEQPRQITSPYEAEKRNLPEAVHRLFYAVKDSLDYAGVTGGIDGELKDIPDDPSPEKSLKDYERVTDSLIEEVDRAFIIEKYSAEEWDYELIVRARKCKNTRYKATRVQMFRYDGKEWKSLGVYLHW